MVSKETLTQLALSFPGTIEMPHFDKISFRWNKKIFLTLDVAKNLACVKLNEIDQSVFCAIDETVIYPVPNKWGKQGWTLAALDKIRKSMLKELLTKAFFEVSGKKTAQKKTL